MALSFFCLFLTVISNSIFEPHRLVVSAISHGVAKIGLVLAELLLDFSGFFSGFLNFPPDEE